MKSKNIIIILFLVATIGLFFTSCEKEDTDKPVIDLSELGYENSKIGYAATDLHVEAEIVADGKIDKVTIEIHSEDEHEKSATSGLDEDGWEFDSTYTEFSGLKNTTFHKHIDIPADADTGHYHFHFIVTDMEGQQTTIEEELEVQQPDDNVAPEINVSSAPSNNQSFNNGETITISGSVSDDKALGGMYIGLVRVNQNLTDAEVNATNTITLLHTHDFDSSTSHSFSASITVGASQDNNVTPKDITGNIAWQSGDCYLVVKCKDAFGGNWTFSNHYPIVINY
jgi:hypothetical protein